MATTDEPAAGSTDSATQDVTEALTSLAKETKAKGWWYSYDDAIPEWFELYVGLESAASRLRHYEPELIPGLLQTPAYTAEVFRVGKPEMPEAQINRGVAVRLARQAILTRSCPPRRDWMSCCMKACCTVALACRIRWLTS